METYGNYSFPYQRMKILRLDGTISILKDKTLRLCHFAHFNVSFQQCQWIFVTKCSGFLKWNLKCTTHSPFPVTAFYCNVHISALETSSYSCTQNCINDLSNSFPEIQSGYDYGNELLADKKFRDKHKDKIEKDMDDIGAKFESLQKDVGDEQERWDIAYAFSFFIIVGITIKQLFKTFTRFWLWSIVPRLSALLAEAYAEDERKAEKTKSWNDWRDKLNSKYKKTRGKFNKIKGQGIPKQPKQVQGQLELTRVSGMYSSYSETN